VTASARAGWDGRPPRGRNGKRAASRVQDKGGDEWLGWKARLKGGDEMKILFASMPFAGHFNPLTGVAAHLKGRGHDVRFYTGPGFAKKLAALGIPHYQFQRAMDLNAENLVQHYPEYEKLGTGPKAIEFALTKIFFGNTEAHLHDVQALHAGFPFDALIFDAAFYAAHLIGLKLGVPIYGIGVGPTPAPTSKTSPPPFFGLKPATTMFGTLQHWIVSALIESTNKKGMKLFNDLLAREGLPAYERSIFDLPCASAKAFFQSGVASMDFPRTDWPANYQFVGALLPPPTASGDQTLPHEEKKKRYPSLVVVSQGTVDNRDPDKLFVPALEALRGGKHLVVACTGNRNTEALRERFPEDNILVEDYIDFDRLLPGAALFICNGGYGSIMQALKNGVPVLSAGKLEGKNDINARLDYCGLGLDLKTERPTPKQIAAGVARVLGEPRFAQNVNRVKAELDAIRPFETIERIVVASATRAS
jgi:MGT family glycosyltransferase